MCLNQSESLLETTGLSTNVESGGFSGVLLPRSMWKINAGQQSIHYRILTVCRNNCTCQTSPYIQPSYHSFLVILMQN